MMKTITTEEQRQAVLAALKGLSLGKKGWDVRWEKHVEKRSLSQSAYYFIVVGLIADDTGNSRDDIHEIMKQKFCPKTFTELEGDVYSVTTTTTLSVPQFSAYLEAVIAFATTEIGLILPARPDQEGAYG